MAQDIYELGVAGEGEEKAVLPGSLNDVRKKNRQAAEAVAPVAAAPAKSRWQKAVDNFGISAEVSNVGIVVNIISKIPGLAAILTVCGGAFAYLAFLTDPLIYCFRALIRITRVIGREFFGIKFEEEKYGTHKLQTVADIVSLALFAVAIPLFFGAIIASPIGLTLAWSLALSGLCVIGYFDYHYQAKMAEAAWKQSVADNGPNHPETEAVHKDFLSKRSSARLFMALLVGLTFLLVCGSAAVFAPPAVVPILLIASQLASVYLGTIACLRFLNWTGALNKLIALVTGKKENAKEIAVEVAPEQEQLLAPAPAPASTTSLTTVRLNELLEEKSAPLTVKPAEMEDKMAEVVVGSANSQHGFFNGLLIDKEEDVFAAANQSRAERSTSIGA